ncbi:hypothetical protein CK203_104462 [Vitis vinifera]|uniref:Uncharacterized protein n=1 Tax=Vitis vinifera TaxID=29760 RepID=A0A438EAP4_VITVI|nr:hypothetical protein CK203_104462 [Vitis vinifera]
MAFLSFVADNADAKERHYETLLTARNLMVVVRESQEYVVNILPRKMPKEVVPGEHYILKDIPIYQEVKEADAEKRRALLDDREKRKNEGTLQKASGQKCSAASPPRKAPAKKRKLVKNGKGVKEPTPPKEFVPLPITHARSCIHKPSRLPPSDADAAEALCVTPMEETGAESQSQPSDDPNRLALVPVKGPPSKRCSLEGSEVEMATETPAVPMVVPDEGAPGETHPAENVEAPNPEEELFSNASSGGNPVNDAACTSASPFSYAELEEKLKQIPPGSTIAMP